MQCCLEDRLLVIAVRGDHDRTGSWWQWVVGLFQPKDLVAEEAMRTQQGRGNRSVTEHGHDRQWNRWLEEDVEGAARQAWVVYDHRAIVVVDTDILR